MDRIPEEDCESIYYRNKETGHENSNEQLIDEGSENYESEEEDYQGMEEMSPVEVSESEDYEQNRPSDGSEYSAQNQNEMTEDVFWA